MNEAEILLKQILLELDCPNLKAIGFVKGKWKVKYFKGKQNTFGTFAEMYDFLLNESK